MNNYYKKIVKRILLFSLILVSNFVIAQENVISGVVTYSDGTLLPGVNILIEGASVGTQTDFDGKFSIKANKGEILVFSYLGMKTKKITIDAKTTINIQLEEDAASLDEIVVIGYGSQRKSDLTGSVSQIKAEDLNAIPNANVQQALAGRAAGVQVTQQDGSPGGSVSVTIRGSNSIQGNNTPLYVVDGFPIGNISILNNSDIESIEILKDASATAIYGSRGANGVVLLTTKQGKSGKMNIDFDSSYSSQSLIKQLDLMNAKEYAQFYNIQASNDGLQPYFTESEVNSFGEGFDWQDFMFRNASMLTNSLSISGGDSKTKYAMSLSSVNQEGILENSDYNRYTIRANIDHQFSKVFRATLSTTNTRVSTGRQDSGGGNRGASLIGAIQTAAPTLTPFNDDGTYNDIRIVYPWAEIGNPIYYTKEEKNTIKSNLSLINAAFVINPLEELTIRISGGYENRDDRSDSYRTLKFVNSDGIARVGTAQFTSLLSENTINYTKTFNDVHNFSALAGVTYQDFLSTELNAGSSGFLSDAFETNDLIAGANPVLADTRYSKNVLSSYLGRFNYNYKNKYYVTASYRADGTSKFSEGNKWGYFPSAALSWRVSEEDFLKDNSTISNLKLRGSYGVTGSQAIDPYETLNILNPSYAVLNDQLSLAFAPSEQLPGDLKWETTEQMDFGIDFGLLNNRFTLTADYYVKNTKDLLNTITLSSSSGYINTIGNVGEVQNKGFELGLDAKVFTGDFKWGLNTNFSINRNKVVKLYGGDEIRTGFLNTVSLQTFTSILSEGRPIGQFYGFIEDGYTDAGQIKYKDTDGVDGITNDDQTFIGDPTPDFIYGINSTMSYKNFDLNIFLQGVYGNDLYNGSSATNSIDYGFGLNLIKDPLYDYWTPTNTDAKYPKISRTTKINGSDRFIEDGSFLRLKNIQFAYNLPVKQMNLNGLQSMQLYVSGQNLLTFTKYSGWDPEVIGVDNRSYPQTKGFTLGTRIRF
ncbi:MAG: TonB-linked SusC/RagA family outer membrane protein [Polaribacter sp.]|jgi:TonB-linked SusC/RagA family outer membrane protein